MLQESQGQPTWDVASKTHINTGINWPTSTGAGFLPSTVSPNWLIYGNSSCSDPAGPPQPATPSILPIVVWPISAPSLWPKHPCLAGIPWYGFHRGFPHEVFAGKDVLMWKWCAFGRRGFGKKMQKTSLPMVGKDTISWKMIRLIGHFFTAFVFWWQERGIYV